MPPRHHKGDYEYFIIDDFRPGIVSDVKNQQPGGIIDTQKPGVAAEGTVGCISTDTGQLVPLPRAQQYRSYQPLKADFADLGNGSAFIAGIATAGPVLYTAGQLPVYFDQVHIFMDVIQKSGATYFDAFEWDVIKPDGSVVNVAIPQGASGPIPPTLTTRGATSAFTRGRRANFNTPGGPILATEWTGSGGLNTGPYDSPAVMWYGVWPDPNAPTTDSNYHETGTVTLPIIGGQLFSYSGRIVRFGERSFGFGANYVLYSNEWVRFSDPPGNVSLTSSTTDSVLDEQTPGGFGAWGSMSFGELFIVKRAGGALLVQGDLYAPQITPLPGVKPTGLMTGPAVATPLGLIYLVNQDGAHLWAGGSQSEKISNINDSFWVQSPLPNYGVQAGSAYWRDLAVFTNGWCFDCYNDSWWQLNSSFSGGQKMQWMAVGAGDPTILYTVPSQLDNTNHVVVQFYAVGALEYSYTWISQPMPLTHARKIDIHEVTVAITNNSSPTTTATISLLSNNNVFVSQIFNFTTTGAGPYRIRLPMAAEAVSNVYVKITINSNAQQPAATLNSITVGYLESGPIAGTA